MMNERGICFPAAPGVTPGAVYANSLKDKLERK